MNEKIKELTKQAGLYEHDEMVFGSTSGYEGVSTEELKKFAELIVRECAVLVEDYYAEHTYLRADLKIMQHFGVD
jgi:hypothetical protein